MKSFFAFFRSMKFGIILLSIIMVFSLLGSLLPQDRHADWFIHTYPKVGQLFVTLCFHHIFSTWYFILTVALLCINITLCSVTRFGKIIKSKQNALARAASSCEGFAAINDEDAEKLQTYLKGRRYRLKETENSSVYYKNLAGYYGSFIVHLSILLVFVFGGLVLYLSITNDYNVMPGETLTMEDGTELFVDDFVVEDETGRTEYISYIHITAPNGKESGPQAISVNWPFTFKSKKYYQYTYGVAGQVTAVNTRTGGMDIFFLSQPSYLSADGRNGIWYRDLYQGYVEDDDGNIIPLYYRGFGAYYPNPIYEITVTNDGRSSPAILKPGEMVQAGEVIFTFNEPVPYPGIRVKHVPNPFPIMLYISFVLLTAGFWLCYFHMPVIVTIRKGSYSVTGSSGVELEITKIINDGKEKNNNANA